MATQQACYSQFDVMMKLAQDKDGVAKMFDPAPRHVPQLPQNNYLFEKVEIRTNDSESRQSVRDG